LKGREAVYGRGESEEEAVRNIKTHHDHVKIQSQVWKKSGRS
jgi:hypothetical protein